MLVNGAASSLVTSYPAGSTGWANDNTHGAAIAAGERFALQLVHGGSGFDGSFTVQSASWELEPA
jgi:hypothetical protein